MIKQVLITVVLGLIIFFFLILQFPQDRRLTLFFINKSIAQTAVILIATSYLLGPLCAVLPFLKKFIHFRKYFGLVGFASVLIHITTSLLQFSDRFPLSWYVEHIFGVSAAIVAILIFSVLAITSNRKSIEKLGGQRWKFIQRTGYIALLLALYHIYVATGPRWQMWLKGEVDMPTSFMVFSLGVIVILVRLLDLAVDAFNKKQKITS